MRKFLYQYAPLAIVVILITAACSAPVKTPVSNSGAPTVGGAPTTAPVIASTSSGVQATSTSSAGSPAPICEASNTCAAANAEQVPLSCVKKIPYTNVFVPKGTTFEVLDKTGNFTCIDSGVVLNDKEVITCHGKQLFSFQLKLTNAACTGTNLTTDTNQCEQGYGYDAAHQCCASMTGGSNGSTTVTINLGGCPLPSP